VEPVHAWRVAVSTGGRVERAQSRFICQLAAITLLGDALFGDLIRASSGEALGGDSAREFRRRLARLMTGAA